MSSADEATAVRYFVPIRIDYTYKAAIILNNNSAPYNLIQGSTTLGTETWYHICSTSNGSEYQIYVNGSRETLTVQNGANNGARFDAASDRDNLTFGASKRSTVVYVLSGFMDEPRIYNRALTS